MSENATTGKQEKKSERARTTICEATIDCLAELGYSETSINRVVERAGVSKGALQHHFPSKEELMASAASYLLARPIEHAARAPSGDLRKRLLAIWDRLTNTRAYLALLEILIASRTDKILHARIAGSLEASIQDIDEHFLPFYGALDAADQDDVLMLMTANRCLMRGLLIEAQYGLSQTRQRQILQRWFDLLEPVLSEKLENG